ncbi:hypothetical protein HYPSUDRAFT_200185 [Hypholoma sublateritium FD-334 SS-4]|uniref:Defective in cullin neddylation protein n=1 Tax=Hypholoma sublateritium (strain FD-334 SS-4) TaxID=945553 RepID=A0A0D2P8E4_HYPSF|nr:hypothetical protein HYPSUDRAFT_200185 [Hypholoma sublateritium FD-334 SS-4]
MVDKKLDADISQFCAITGASARDARKFLEAHKRLDIAIDAYYTNPAAFASTPRRKDAAPPSTNPDEDDITVDGTIQLCSDLGVDPEDVVLLAVAFELKSPAMGRWTRAGWIEGWKAIGTDTLPAMQTALERLRDQLATDPAYFAKVYTHTFDFARAEGQRSLGLETAIALWGLLLPHGLEGGALAHSAGSDDEGDEDDAMDGDAGWPGEYTQWWFDFLTQKGGKGVSKDTWVMVRLFSAVLFSPRYAARAFLEFVRSMDASFANYDMEAAWPSMIDDFVEYGKARLASGGT